MFRGRQNSLWMCVGFKAFLLSQQNVKVRMQQRGNGIKHSRNTSQAVSAAYFTFTVRLGPDTLSFRASS